MIAELILSGVRGCQSSPKVESPSEVWVEEAVSAGHSDHLNSASSCWSLLSRCLHQRGVSLSTLRAANLPCGNALPVSHKLFAIFSSLLF